MSRVNISVLSISKINVAIISSHPNRLLMPRWFCWFINTILIGIYSLKKYRSSIDTSLRKLFWESLWNNDVIKMLTSPKTILYKRTMYIPAKFVFCLVAIVTVLFAPCLNPMWGLSQIVFILVKLLFLDTIFY